MLREIKEKIQNNEEEKEKEKIIQAQAILNIQMIIQGGRLKEL